MAQRGGAAVDRGLIQRLVASVETGANQNEQAGATMMELVQSVREVTVIMDDISNASAEQSSGLDQLSRAMFEVDSLTSRMRLSCTS